MAYANCISFVSLFCARNRFPVAIEFRNGYFLHSIFTVSSNNTGT